MKYALLATTALVSACAATPDVRPYAMPESAAVSPFQDVYGTGKKHLMADRAGLAIVYFEQSLAIDPFSVAALNAIGAAYDQLLRFEIAKLYYMRALDIEPNGADTLNNMATSAAMAGDREAAAKLFARAAGLAPDDPTIRGNMRLADATTSKDDREEADDDRPRIERTGVAELTLTIPAANAQAINTLMDAFRAQESGNRFVVPTSLNGAVGPMQLMPATFRRYAKPGEDIRNPHDNTTVARRLVADLRAKYGRDTARIAVAYFSGAGNVASLSSATPWIKDRADKNGKNVSSYVQNIRDRLKGKG
jgi:Flp pilus assembly protein TadD